MGAAAPSRADAANVFTFNDLLQKIVQPDAPISRPSTICQADSIIEFANNPIWVRCTHQPIQLDRFNLLI